MASTITTPGMTSLSATSPDERSEAIKKIRTYLALTTVFSAIFYALIISAGTLRAHGGLYVFALMWSPGTAALLTRLIHQRNVRGEGWKIGRPISGCSSATDCHSRTRSQRTAPFG